MPLFIVKASGYAESQHIPNNWSLNQTADVGATAIRHAGRNFTAKCLGVGVAGDQIHRAAKRVSRKVSRLGSFDHLDPLKVHEAQRGAAIQHVHTVNKQSTRCEAGRELSSRQASELQLRVVATRLLVALIHELEAGRVQGHIFKIAHVGHQNVFCAEYRYRNRNFLQGLVPFSSGHNDFFKPR